MTRSRVLLSFVAVLLIVMACTSIPNHEEIRTTDLVRMVAKVTPFVVQVETLDAYGTGTLIRHDQIIYVLTCYHLFKENPRQPLLVHMADGTQHTAIYDYGNRAYDLALLRVPDLQKNHRTIEMSYDALLIGEEIVVLGYPAGCGFSISSGVVSGLHKRASMRDKFYGGAQYFQGLVQTDAPVNPGNSGGPVVDITGRLIGIAQLTNLRYDGIGLFISVPKIREFLNGLGNRQPLLLDSVVREMVYKLATKAWEAIHP